MEASRPILSHVNRERWLRRFNDACHGRVSKVLWNGKQQTIFHYDATIEYPYTIGCFEGTQTKSNAVVF